MSFSKLAKEYRDLGFSVIPISPKTKSQPAFPWAKYQNTLPTEAEIEQWCKLYPDHNIAIITGKVSNLAVMDVDGQEGMDIIKQQNVEPTWIAETGKGFHYYYRLPRADLGNAAGVFPKIDVRANGGYVIAPGSTHSSGKQYSWYMREGEISKNFPEFILEKMGVKTSGGKEKDGAPVSYKWLAEAKSKGIDKGSRNNTFARVAGHYFNMNYAIEDVVELMLNINDKCKDPLPGGEIKEIAKSIQAREERRKGGPIKTMALPDAKEIISKHLKFKDDTVIDVALAVGATVKSASDSLWIIFVGGSSTGKTEVLMSYKNYDDAYYVDRITAAGIASGHTTKKGFLERNQGCRKLLVVQDFSSIMAKSPNDMGEILDALRQIYNGHYKNEWAGKVVSWSGKFNLLSGSTPEIESSKGTMAELGERFLYYRIKSDEAETRRAMYDKSSETCGIEAKMRKDIEMAMLGVLHGIRKVNVDEVTIDEKISEPLFDLIDMSTTLRTAVKRHYYRQDDVEYEPCPEGPGRMNKAIRTLMKGLAVVRGRMECDMSDYAVALKICVDSIPSVRRRVLKGLLANQEKGWRSAKLIAKDCGYVSSESARIKLEDLAALKLCERRLDGDELPGWGQNQSSAWQFVVKKETVKKLRRCGMEFIL